MTPCIIFVSPFNRNKYFRKYLSTHDCNDIFVIVSKNKVFKFVFVRWAPILFPRTWSFEWIFKIVFTVRLLKLRWIYVAVVCHIKKYIFRCGLNTSWSNWSYKFFVQKNPWNPSSIWRGLPLKILFLKLLS